MTRVHWRQGDHIVVRYADGSADVLSGSRQLAAELADQEGLSTVRAPLGQSEWEREPLFS